MNTFKINYEYGCGAFGDLEIDAENGNEARRKASDLYDININDIHSVTQLTFNEEAVAA